MSATIQVVHKTVARREAGPSPDFSRWQDPGSNAARAALQKAPGSAISSKDSHEIKRKCALRGVLRFAFVLKNGYNREVAGRAAFHVRLRCDHR